MNAFIGGDNRKGTLNALILPGGNIHANTAPKNAAAAPKKGPRINPKTVAINASSWICRSGRPIDGMKGEINDNT
jgi:hypothetical protein